MIGRVSMSSLSYAALYFITFSGSVVPKLWRALAKKKKKKWLPIQYDTFKDPYKNDIYKTMGFPTLYFRDTLSSHKVLYQLS